MSLKTMIKSLRFFMVYCRGCFREGFFSYGLDLTQMLAQFI